MQVTDDRWADEVLRFWFEELTPEQWFESTPEMDETVRRRFGALHGRLGGLPDEAVYSDPRAALAAVIVLDQFSRNMHRGTAEAFASDAVAIAIARNALDEGLVDELDEDERSFLYMPFMHSEVLADQERCVSLFRGLEGDGIKHAIEHRDIVAAYGRFPHRNAVLGRESTPAEKEFLAGHRGFGQ